MRGVAKDPEHVHSTLRTILSGKSRCGDGLGARVRRLCRAGRCIVATMSDVEGEGEADGESRLAAKSFGSRLQAAREDRGLLQEEAARQLGYPVRSVSRWESGTVVPSVLKAGRMADLYRVSLDWLVGRTTIKGLLTPGAALWSPSAVDVLQALADAGHGVDQVPPHLWRAPGVNCSTVIPEDAVVLKNGSEAALLNRVAALLEQIKRKVK